MIDRTRAGGVPLALLAAAALASGCGGGDDDEPSPDGPPKPRESLESVLPDYERAAAEQDCRAFARFTHSAVRPGRRDYDDPPDADECASLASSYVNLEGFHADKQREFGTAALAEGRIASRRTALVWTLDTDRRWKQVQATPPGIPEQIGGLARPGGNRFAANAARWVEALRSGNCRRAFRLSNSANPLVTQEGDDRARFCRRFAEARRLPVSLSAQLARSPGAKPVDLGGTPNFRFFGIETAGGGHWTIISTTLPPGLPPGDHVEDSVLDYYPNRQPEG